MIRKEHEMLFQLNAQVNNSFNSSFSKAQAQFAKMQQEIQSLNKIQSEISAYQKQQGAVDKTQEKLSVLQKQYDNIQKEIQETEGFSSSLENKLLSKQQQIEKTSAALESQTVKLSKMGDALKDAGVDTDNLSKESSDLTAKMDDLRDKQEEVAQKANKFGSSSVGAVEEIQAAMAAAGLAKLYKEIAEEIVECTKESIEFESAITGVYKTVDGAEEQLSAITQGIKDMSTEIPAGTTEIASVAEAAGQLGVATEDVLSFTRVMIDLGESTNLSADDASSALAKFANITGTAAADYSRLGSVIVDLGNNFATTEADIVEMSTRLASSGSIAGLTEAEILALAAAMSSVGIGAEAGGTAMTQTLSTIEKAVAKGGESLSEFARISGMSVDEFTNAWENRPIEAIQAFIAGVGNLDAQGESAVLVLEELGLTGIRQSNMLKSLGLAAETLGKSVSTANTAWEENSALSVEAGKRYATTESQLAMLENSYKNLQVAIGDVYAPTLLEASQIGADMMAGLTEFVENNPELIKMFTALAVGVGAFSVALAGYIVVANLAEKATKALKAAMDSNHYLLAISAIVGVVAAIGTLIATTDSAEDSVNNLTSASQAQKEEIENLEKEYQKLCDAGKETSEEALLLQYRIENLSNEFENNKQTIEEYLKECDDLNESIHENIDANREASDEIEHEEKLAFALVNKLVELSSQTNITAKSTEEMKSIVSGLNELLPDLNLNYKDVTDGVVDFRAAVEASIKAQYAQQKQDKANKGMLDSYSDMKKAEEQLADLRQKRKAALEQQRAAEKAFLKTVGTDYDTFKNRSSLLDDIKISMTISEDDEIVKARDEVDKYNQRIKETKNSLEEAETEYNNFLGEIVESADSADTTIVNTMTKLSELSEAYNAVYNAALESIQGQYSIWDDADKIVAKSASSINSALKSQAEYWSKYNSNLDALTDRSGEIDGLSEMISEFADGSNESVNAVAGMAKASNSELKQMVENWKKVKEEQSGASESLAELKTSFDSEVAELAEELTKDIKAMDLSKEAANSAKVTMQGFIDGATEMLPEIQAAYKAIGDAAINAMPGGKKKKGNDVPRYAVGTKSAEPGFALVGENGPELIYFNGGEEVVTAHETAALQQRLNAEYMQIAMLEPRFVAAMQAYSGGVTSAQPVVAASAGSSGSPVSINVVFQIEGNATPETVDALQTYGDDFSERVLTVVKEAGIDIDRRTY